jgi:hypothetical protein
MRVMFSFQEIELAKLNMQEDRAIHLSMERGCQRVGDKLGRARQLMTGTAHPLPNFMKDPF